MKPVFLCVIVTAATAFAQVPANSTARYSITGTVLDADTGAPIALARVTVAASEPPVKPQPQAKPIDGTQPVKLQDLPLLLDSPKRPQVLITTDPAGTFSVTNAPRDTYAISAARTGYLSVDDPNHHTYATVNLNGTGNTSSRITLYLRRQAVLQGTVLDENGAGIGGTLFLFRLSWKQGRMVPRQVTTVSPKPDGSFRVAELWPGRYYAAFSAYGDGRDRAFPITIYPNAADIKSAQILDLAPGRDEQIHFQVSSQPAHKISGRFDASDDRTGLSLRAAVHPTGLEIPANYGIEVDQRNHTFHFTGLLPGQYRLSMDRAGERIGSTLVTVTSHDVAGLELHPAPPPQPVRGVVKFDIPLTASTNIEQPTQHNVFLDLESERGIDATTMLADGTFFFDRLPPGSARLTIRAENPHYVKSARQGSRDLLRNEVIIPEEGSPTPIDVELATGSARLSGTVADPDGKPDSQKYRGFYIEVFRHIGESYAPQFEGYTGRPQSATSAVMTTLENRFETPELPPGDYMVFAWRTSDGTIQQLAYDTEDFQTTFRSAIVRVTLKDSTTSEIQIPKPLPSSAFQN